MKRYPDGCPLLIDQIKRHLEQDNLQANHWVGMWDRMRDQYARMLSFEELKLIMKQLRASEQNLVDALQGSRSRKNNRRRIIEGFIAEHPDINQKHDEDKKDHVDEKEDGETRQHPLRPRNGNTNSNRAARQANMDRE